MKGGVAGAEGGKIKVKRGGGGERRAREVGKRVIEGLPIEEGTRRKVVLEKRMEGDSMSAEAGRS